MLDPTYQENHYVTKEIALYREKLLSNVSYEVIFALPRGDSYYGSYKVSFELGFLPAAAKPLFLDFRGKKIDHLCINGVDVPSPGDDQKIFHSHKIYLDSSKLKEGANTVRLTLFNNYKKDGVGLHSFVDQADKEQYLYTQFEPDSCHHAFPVFDQPSVKAKWQFSCIVPGDWAVVSNENPKEITDEEKVELEKTLGSVATDNGIDSIQGGKQFIFPQSPKISSYLYAIVAGPYDFHENKTEGMPPMKIYARKSLLEQVTDFNEMFKVTQAGIRFYEKLFGQKYPFNKYDQVFVPEHNYGAMENVGCVTYNELYLYIGQTPTLAKRLRFSITNLHELAHMWFGNLVTMKWWDDLWLNESFATYMSFLSMTGSEELQYFDTAWTTFLRYKFWGINTDQKSSTHSICCDIKSTAEAVSIFDGISYGKGSAFLKQVYFVLGYETMQNGLIQYFEKYKWTNTELPDFIGCLAKAFEESGDKSMGDDFDLLDWCDSWLNTSGVNILEPVVEYNDDGSIKSLAIKQTCGLRGNNRIRKHKLNILLYEANTWAKHEITNIIVSDKDELTPVPVDFKGPVSCLLLNSGDHAYCKVRYDDKTLKSFHDDFGKVDLFNERACIWRHLFQMVMDCKMSSLDYIDFVVKHLPKETVEQSIEHIVLQLESLCNNYVPIDKVDESRAKMFDALLLCLGNMQNDGAKIPIATGILPFITTKPQVDLAISWVEKGSIMPNTYSEDQILYELQQNDKFTILKTLYKLRTISKEQKQAVYDLVMNVPESDIKGRVIKFCEAAKDDAGAKAAAWELVTAKTSELTLYERSALLQGFYSWDQQDICEPYYSKFYDVLADDFQKHHPHKYQVAFMHNLLPRMNIKDEHIAKLLEIKSEVPDSEKAFMNQLQDQIENLLASKKVRQFAAVKAKADVTLSK